MRFFATAFLSLFFTVLLVQACPPSDEEMEPILKPLIAKFNRDICGQGIKPGGAADVEWVKKHVISYYLSKAFLGKELPTGWEKERDKIIKKCHKNSYNYCVESDQHAVADCVKGSVGSLMLKYGSTVMSYCPLIDKIIEEWPTKYEKGAMALISSYCKMKGKTC